MSVVQLMTPDYSNSSYVSHFPGIEDRAKPAVVEMVAPEPPTGSKPETGAKAAPKKVSAPKAAPSGRPNISARGKKKV